jgi:hypothetical protein
MLADPAIVIQLQLPGPASLRTNYDEKISSFLFKTPHGTSRKLLKNHFSDLNLRRDGLLSLYAGYLDFSSRDGMITFPLRHVPASKLYVVITPYVELNFIAGQTISHASLPNGKQDVVSYVFEKKKDANNMWFWSIRKTFDAINDGRISPLAIVLLAKPRTIFVKTGDHMSSESSNVVIPNTLYVVGNYEREKILVNALGRLNYFEPIEWLNVKPSEKLKQKIISNT